LDVSAVLFDIAARRFARADISLQTKPERRADAFKILFFAAFRTRGRPPV
jgi:hypothetical protein